jgi:hypothetical protein
MMQILTKTFNDIILSRMSLTCDNRCVEEISTELYNFLKKIIFLPICHLPVILNQILFQVYNFYLKHFAVLQIFNKLYVNNYNNQGYIGVIT